MSATANVSRLLQGFITDRLVRQRQASSHTIAAYRDTFRLLLEFAEKRLAKQPAVLGLEDLDAPLIGAFLDHLEKERRNSTRTRNARLAAIHSFFRYAALQEPSYGAVTQRVLAMPSKRHTRKLVGFLTAAEVDALLALLIALAGAGVATTRCSCWPCRPGFASRSSWVSVARISSSGLEPTCDAMARGARSAAHRCGREPQGSCATGSGNLQPICPVLSSPTPAAVL